MKVVYIAGPIRATNYYERELNIRRAEKAALDIARLGFALYIPHSAARFFQGALPEVWWMKADLELVARSDAVFLVKGWQFSEGAIAEKEYAEAQNIPVFETLRDLMIWGGNGN